MNAVDIVTEKGDFSEDEKIFITEMYVVTYLFICIGLILMRFIIMVIKNALLLGCVHLYFIPSMIDSISKIRLGISFVAVSQTVSRSTSK